MARKRTSKGKVTQTQKEYRKERRRIQRQINRMINRGYIVPENLLPPTPKTVTKASVRRLKKIDTKSIYRKSLYIDIETGEQLTGEQGRKLERSISARKASQTRRERKPHTPPTPLPSITDVVIGNYLAQLNAFANAPLAQNLATWFNKILSEYGREETAKMLSDGTESGYIINWEVLYNSESFNTYITGMLEYLPSMGVFGTDKFFDELEQSEEWVDLRRYKRYGY